VANLQGIWNKDVTPAWKYVFPSFSIPSLAINKYVKGKLRILVL
jgi:hypothetical protein